MEKRRQIIPLLAIILATIAIAGEIFIFATQRESSDEIQRKAIRQDYRVYAPVLPDTLYFAGEAVPMDEYYVRERLDRELLSNMYFQSNTVQILKRAGRYFPEIEKILKANNVPEDFKYLCVIESSLTNATSPAKAQGFWQFMPATGKSYGLEINSEVDMRNDLKASTEAACRYLKKLHQRFGSWTSAAAAYNCGENGLERRYNEESTRNYYNVRLNRETARYVYRILAFKLIMQQPQDYGYHLRKCDLYPALPYISETINGKDINLYDYAKSHGCSYLVFKEMNPWLISDKLSNPTGKSYTVKLPTTNGTKMSVIVKGKKDTSFITKM